MGICDKSTNINGRYIVQQRGGGYLPPAAPSITVSGSDSDAERTVTMASTSAGAVVHYTTDDSTPTASSPSYSEPVKLVADGQGQTTTIVVKAVSIRDGLVSDVVSQTVTLTRQVAKPTINANGDEYSTERTVTIATTTPGATIRYTTDGSTPTEESAVYDAPKTLIATSSVKAFAELEGWTDSAVETATIKVGTLKMYYGTVAEAPTTEAGVKALANSVKAKSLPQTFEFGTMQSYARLCFAYASSLGDLTSIADALGECIMDYTKTVVGNFNVYTLNNTVMLSESYSITIRK